MRYALRALFLEWSIISIGLLCLFHTDPDYYGNRVDLLYQCVQTTFAPRSRDDAWVSFAGRSRLLETLPCAEIGEERIIGTNRYVATYTLPGSDCQRVFATLVRWQVLAEQRPYIPK